MKSALQHSRLLYGAAHSLLRREAGAGAAAAGPWFTWLAGTHLQAPDNRCAVPGGLTGWPAHHWQTSSHQGFSSWAPQVAHDEQPATSASGRHHQKQAHDTAAGGSKGGTQWQRPIPVVPPPITPTPNRGKGQASSSSSSRGSGASSKGSGGRSQHSTKTSKAGISKSGRKATPQKGKKRALAAQRQQQQHSKPNVPVLFAECKTVPQLLEHLPSKLTALQARSALQQLVYIVKGERWQPAGYSRDTPAAAAIAGASAGVGADTTATAVVEGASSHSMSSSSEGSSSSSSGSNGSSSSSQAAGHAVVQACSACLQRTQPLAAADAALLAYAAVKVGQADTGLLPALEVAVMARGAALSPLDASRLAVACSLGGPSWASPVLLRALTTACAQHLRDMTPSFLVSTLRHLTLAGARFPELMEAAADRLLQGMHSMGALTASKVLWLFAKQGVHDQAVLGAVSERIAMGLHQLSPGVLNDVAWACSRLQYHDGKLCMQLTQRLQQQLRGGPSLQALPGPAGTTSQGPATTVDSSSTPSAAFEQSAATLYFISLQRPHAPGLMDAAADHVVAHSSSYTPAALCALTWSMAMSRHQRPDALESIAQQALALLPQMDPDEVAKLVVALCAVKAPGPAAGAFFTAAMPRLQQQAAQLSQLQLVEAVRALSVWPNAARMQGTLAGASRSSSSSSSLGDQLAVPSGQFHSRYEVLRSLAQEAISSRRQLTKQQALNVYHALRRTHQQELQEQLAALVLQLGGTQVDLLGSRQEADSWQQRFAGE